MDEPRRLLVYSVAKTWLGVLCLRLGLDLDACVQAWIPDERLPRATLRQLLRHTAGVPDYGRLPEYHAAVEAHPLEPWPDEELLSRALALGPDFAPDEGWAYSNTGYLLVRTIVELEAGDLGATLARELIAPLGLGHTTLALEPVRGYDPRWVGHRTLLSTEADQRVFWTALARGDLCDLDVLAEPVLVPFEAPGFTRPGYGLGVMTDERPDGLLIGHGGGGPHFSAGAFALLRPGREPLVRVVLRDDGSDAQAEALAQVRDG